MNHENIYEKGFIKLSKNILEWQWYTDPNVTRLYIHILLKVNFKQKNWKGIDIKIGEFITSVDKLHIELNLSVQTIRTALKKLEKSEYIEVRPTSQYSLIKLRDSDVFILEDNYSNKQNNKQKTNEQQISNNQTTTTNKEKKEKNIKDKKEVFQAELDKHKNDFSSEVLISFFNYWTEETKNNGRLRFEDQKFWNLSTRLSSWTNFKKTENKKTFNRSRNHGRI
jgi:DNA-binding transcriptional regulator YhcF (GntR family)